LGEVRNLWPLLFLAAPVIYALLSALSSPTSGLMFVLFTAWVGVALWFLKRRQPGDVPRAVVSLIAGIALLDAVLIAAAGAPAIAWLAVAGFMLTVALQRLVPGT
jgi:4-hydroxybenzoate polyprenyltransferase